MLSEATRTSRRDDFVTMALAFWMLIGLMVDAYFHSTDPGLESFWTPWHGLFYSGFTATAIWIVRLSLARRRPSGGLLDWAPPGYRLALIGLGVFAAGGFGDAVWHTTLGVETGIDALLSPTHLLLFLGMLMIVSAPIRAAWQRPTPTAAPTLGEFMAPLASVTFTTALIAFFFEYLWLPANDWAPSVPFRSNGGESELVAVLGIAGAVFTTVILMTGPIAISRRWILPFGSVTILFMVVNALITYGFDESAVGMLPVIAAGLVADTALQADLPRPAFLIATPAVLLLGYYLMVGRTGDPLRWPPEIWGGSVVMAVLAALAVDQLLDIGQSLPGPAGSSAE